MPDKKLTDEEIPNVKELLEYKVKVHCELCDLKKFDSCGSCMFTATKQFIELFNRLQAENERLKAKCENTQIGYNFLKADFEELKADKIIAERKEKDARDLFKSTVGQLKQIKSEAYKEFAERLKKKKLHIEDEGQIFKMVHCYEIDNLLKELVGDNNASTT